MIPTNKDLKQYKWIKDSNQYWLYSDINEKEEEIQPTKAFAPESKI